MRDERGEHEQTKGSTIPDFEGGMGDFRKNMSCRLISREKNSCREIPGEKNSYTEIAGVAGPFFRGLFFLVSTILPSACYAG